MTIRRGRVAAAVALIVLAAGWKAWNYAAPPGPKDCSPAGAPAAGAGRLINDVSCLNPTRVQSLVAARLVED